MRKVKNLKATMFEDAVTVELEDVSGNSPIETLAVYRDGKRIGYVTSFSAQSERKMSGTRLVHRGKPFKAWAQRSSDDDRFDYYMQHRSQSAAIRRLINDNR